MSKVVAEVDRWIELELYTERLYDWFASRAAGEHAKALFTRLSGAGQHHAKILRKVKTILHRSKEDAKPIEVDFYTSLERREEPFKANYATDVEEAYYTMKEHLQLELDMMKFYKQMVRSLKDHDAISHLRTLAND